MTKDGPPVTLTAVVVKRQVMGQGVRDVSTKGIESFAPGIGSAITSGTPLPDGAQFVPSTGARRGAWGMVAGNTAFVTMVGVLSYNTAQREGYFPWWTLLGFALWVAILAWRPYRELRGRSRLGLYVTPDVLVIHRSNFKESSIVPRASVIDVHAVEDRLPTRAAVSVTALTPREKSSTRIYGTVDLPRDELDALLREWWHGTSRVETS